LTFTCLGGQNDLLDVYLRHGLVDGFYTVSESKFIHNFLVGVTKVHLPGVLADSLWQFDIAKILIACVMKQVLMEARVLDMVRRHLMNN
jgi:hypothetical protein